MKSAVLLAAALLLCSCATRLQVPRVYTQPSSAPVRESVARATGGVEKARTRTAELGRTKLDKAQSAMVVALSRDLDGVHKELRTAKDEVLVLDVRVAEQTDKLNKTEAQRVEAHNARVTLEKRINAYWGLGAIGYGFQRLARNILILLAVVVILLGVAYGLSFLFPIVGVVLGLAWGFLARAGPLLSRLWKRKSE